MNFTSTISLQLLEGGTIAWFSFHGGDTERWQVGPEPELFSISDLLLPVAPNPPAPWCQGELQRNDMLPLRHKDSQRNLWEQEKRVVVGHTASRGQETATKRTYCDSTYKRLTNRVNTIRTVAAYGEQGLAGKGWRELSERDGNVLCLIGVFGYTVHIFDKTLWIAFHHVWILTSTDTNVSKGAELRRVGWDRRGWQETPGVAQQGVRHGRRRRTPWLCVVVAQEGRPGSET